MAEKRYYLTRSDLEVLKGLIRRERDRPQNSFNRPAQPFEPPQAPEVYVALTPSSGIPALSGSTPGSAECNIYRLDVSSSPYVLESVDGLTRIVYNLSQTAVNGTIFTLAVRDKSGSWLAVGQSCGVVDTPATGTGGGGGDFPAAITATWLSNCTGSCIGTDNGTFEMTYAESAQNQYYGTFTPSGCGTEYYFLLFQFENGSDDWYWSFGRTGFTIDSGGPVQLTSSPPDPVAFPQVAADISGTGGFPCDQPLGSGAAINFTAEE